jgi:hypothetical protein
VQLGMMMMMMVMMMMLMIMMLLMISSSTPTFDLFASPVQVVQHAALVASCVRQHAVTSM